MWLALLFLLSVFVVNRYFRGKLLGDTEMLAVGAILYVVLPFVAFEYNWLIEMPGVENWRELFQGAYDRSGQIAVLCVGLTMSYMFGRQAASVTAARLGSTMNRPISKLMLALVAIGLWSIWAATAVLNWESFFQGYSIDYDTGLLGNLATVNLVALAVVLSCRQFQRKGAGYGSLCILLVTNSIALLSLGGRLYVIIPVVAVLLQTLSTVKSTAGRVRLFVGLAIVVAVLLVVGVLRIGADFSPDFLAYIGLAEGIFTSMSLGSFVEHNGIPILSAPFNFFGSIANFIPSAMIADKAVFVPSIQDSGRYFESPLGATHLLVAVLGNFGWLGGLLFACVLGWTIGAVRKVSPSGWWLYFYLSSLLPFMFFRDGFSIFNKAALFNGCIVMWFIVALDGALRVRISPRRNTATGHPQ